MGLVLAPPGLAPFRDGEAELLAPVDEPAHQLLLLAYQSERPGHAPVHPGGPERLLEAPRLAPGLDDGMGPVHHGGHDGGVAVSQDVGRSQPAVVLVDAQQAGLHLEETHHVDHRVDRGQRHALGEAGVEVRDLTLGHADHPHGPQSDVAGRCGRVVALVAGKRQRHGHHRKDACRAQVGCRPDGDDLDDPAVDVVVVRHGAGREDHGHAGRGDGAVDEIHRAGGGARRGGARIGLHDRPVLGDEAEDAGTQRGDGQTQLQARTLDQGGVDGADAVTGAVAEGVGQGLEIEDRAAAGAQVAPHPGEPETCTGGQPQQVALSLPAGPARLTPRAASGGGGRHHPALGLGADGAERERGAGALDDLAVDLASERGPLESAQPGLLPEDVLGLRPGQHVPFDLVDPLRELGQRAGLRQHGGRDGAGGGGGDDVRCDPLHADEVLQHADLERPLGASAGEDERRWGRCAGWGSSSDSDTAPVGPQRRSAARGGGHHLDQRPRRGRVSRPTPNAGSRSGRRRRPPPSGRPPPGGRPPGRRPWSPVVPGRPRR